MAEWLRREIRNLMGSARVGSNPAGVEGSNEFSFSLAHMAKYSPCGLMAKALVSGAKDCGFESRQGCVCCFLLGD